MCCVHWLQIPYVSENDHLDFRILWAPLRKRDDYRCVLPHPGYARLKTGALSTLGKRSSNRATASAQKQLLDFIFKLFIMKD